MEKLDTILQDAKALLKSARTHAASEGTPGVSARLADALAGAVERAAAEDLNQRNAMRETGRLTEAQDKAMAEALDHVRRIRLAGKASFKKAQKQSLKDFRIGSGTPATVKAALAELAYLINAARRHMADLAVADFRADDLAAAETSRAALEAADVSQELGKKTQKSATMARNDGYAALREAVRRVRSAAKAAFLRRPEVLVEFESTARPKASKPKGPRLVEKREEPKASPGA
ncbi:MAG: hypothetical protein JXD23_01065 [Spirochaetales bacterium]|nr:hypothetical protein [Spirochaetales bacterium]